MKKHFPTMIVDNFLENPDKVRKIALDMDYLPSPGHFPGVRTDNISEINIKLFEYLSARFFLLLYDFVNPVQWSLSINFQKINSFSHDKNDLVNHGWTHTDDNKILAGILYLNPVAQLDTGTSILKTNDFFDENMFMTNELQSSKIPFYKNGNKPNNYENNLKKHNDMFSETVNVSNVYNRLIMLDAFEFHRAQNYYSFEQEPRLICTFFVDKLSTDSLTPLERIRKQTMEHYGL